MSDQAGRRRAPAACMHAGATLSSLLALGACAGEPPELGSHEQALYTARLHEGKKLFESALPGSNGRACASCHVLDEGGTLHPESVERRLRENPGDPLFNRLDADDPAAAELTFEHLKKGLVRVTLPLPENVDVIDAEGAVITPPDRTIFVWRGVPAVADTASTAPYQLDGREATLQHQAQSAFLAHSEGGELPGPQLDLIAEFQENLFSSPRARFVSRLIALGVPEERVPMPEAFAPLTAQERRGRALYDAACLACHGGATTDRIVRRDIHSFLSPSLTPEGNVSFEVEPGQPPKPMTVERPGVEFMNAGFGAATYVGQIGLAPGFNASVELPRYRFRFYVDGTRQQKRVDLPPTPVTVSGDPFDLRAQRDERGAPIVGPNLIPQAFTTDPGRAAITGDPADFEAFDVPQLRGIARTAPYFHDNSRETLRDVIDEYSRFLLPFLTPLGLPTHPPEQPGGRPESLTPAEKEDLLAFLNKL
jgi:cytochrome c peroxidase